MKLKWYLQTWLIAVLAALWPFVIPAIIAFILLILQSKEQHILAENYMKQKEEEANEIIESAKVEASNLVAPAKKEAEILNNRISQLQEESKKLKAEIARLTKDAVVETINLSSYEKLTSEECKDQLTILRMKQTELVKNDKALAVTSGDPKKVLNNNIKQLLRCFNSECSYIIDNVSVKNIDTTRGKIRKSFETLNNIFSTDGVALSYEFLEMKLEELNLIYAFALKKEQERETQKAIREQLLDEEKARKELERERQKLEKEEIHFRNEVKKLMNNMQRTNSEVEKNFYIEQIKSIEEKLEVIAKDKEDIINREQNTRAGFVYIISNIGAFGENIYKIGMTRRLDPMDRINELGDASVPFKFDVHAIIFSEDAPTLESALHDRFREYELNKVNSRKEFFRVNLSEIQKSVSELHEGQINWTIEPPAFDYRESLRQSVS